MIDYSTRLMLTYWGFWALQADTEEVQRLMDGGRFASLLTILHQAIPTEIAQQDGNATRNEATLAHHQMRRYSSPFGSTSAPHTEAPACWMKSL